MTTLEQMYRGEIRRKKSWMVQKDRAVRSLVTWLSRVEDEIGREAAIEKHNGDMINYAADEDHRLRLSERARESSSMNELVLEWICWVCDEVREQLDWPET